MANRARRVRAVSLLIVPVALAIAGDGTTAAAAGYAIVGPGRLVVGKNVLIEGLIGTRYGVVKGELDADGADPLVMRSDFYGLSAELDATLDTLYAQVVLHDVNGDNRLRPDHPVEGAGLVCCPELVDYDANGDVDDFDLFLARFDADADGAVTYRAPFASSLAREFAGIDDALARLVDETRPDRDGDGRVTILDALLGYRDGVLDGRDGYGKVHGSLRFAVSRAAWEAARGGSYQEVVQGPILAARWNDTVRFEEPEMRLPEITADLFEIAWFEAQVPPKTPRKPGDPPLDPALLVAEALVAGPHAEYVPASENDWEPVPFGSDGVFDWYQRPVFRDYTFRNVRIPMGNNALYVNCTFVGVTFVESEARCTHKDWNYAGAVEPVDDGYGNIIYVLRFPDLPPPPPDHICIDGVEVRDTRLYSNNIRFHDCTFLGSISGVKLDEHTHWRNVVTLTGATRWFIDIDEVDPTLTDAAGIRLIDYLENMTEDDREELASSSLPLPTWTVHLGSFGADTDGPPVRMKGRIVAGTLDLAGTIDIHGTVFTTFHPEAGVGPLSYGGHPSAFETTFGTTMPDAGPTAIRVRHDPAVGLPSRE